MKKLRATASERKAADQRAQQDAALRGGDQTQVLSRNRKGLGRRFPEVANSIAALDVHDAIIDGEIVALDEKGRSSFQLLQGFDMGTERPPIGFYAFDLLQLNGKDLKTLPIEERKAKLAELLINPSAALRYSTSFTKDIDELSGKGQESRVRRSDRQTRWLPVRGRQNAQEPGSKSSCTWSKSS
jgi:hypothetical protein